MSEREQLLASPFLFRFAVPCWYKDPLWKERGAELDETHRLPCYAELDDEPGAPSRKFADVRAAWSEAGLAFAVHVEGKRQPPWCRQSRVEESDGLAVWIDTRDTHNVHRAGRYCHQFHFLPSGGGRSLSDAVAVQVAIARAKSAAKLADPSLLQVRGERQASGYFLEALVPAKALAGWDPAEHPRIGFMYAVLDRELGEQTLSVSGEFPYQNDPSLWGTLELVGA